MIIKKRSEIEHKEKIKEEPQAEKSVVEDKVDLFDLDNIEFSQRQERRRGNRRRGYRRIDDRNLISRAQEEAGTIRENAAREGYKSGLEKAQGDIEQVKNAIGDFLKAKTEVFEYIAPDILEISIDIARKIVKKEIEQNPQLILESILDVLKSISKDETKVSIKVNPEQVALVKEYIPEIISSTGLEAKTNIVSDDTIEVGSCIVQTSNGIVDATIDTQLEIIKEAFRGM